MFPFQFAAGRTAVADALTIQRLNESRIVVNIVASLTH